MSTLHNTASQHEQYVSDRSWFIVFGVVMLFATVWAIVGVSAVKVAFAGAAFIFFLHAGISFEMSARRLADPHAH